MLLAVLDVEALYRSVSYCAALLNGIALIIVDMTGGAQGSRIGCNRKDILTAQD